MSSIQAEGQKKGKKQFWLKIIDPNDPVLKGDHAESTGMSLESIKRVKESSEENAGGFTTFNAYRIIEEGDFMLLKVIENDFLYFAKIKHIDWDKPVAGTNWVHHFSLEDFKPLGTISFSKYRDEIQFMHLLSSLKYTFSIGMWRISREDFVTIRRLALE